MSDELPPRLKVADLRQLVSDTSLLSKGTHEIFDSGRIHNMAQHKRKLYGDAQGSGASPYKVTLAFAEGPKLELRPRCSCPQGKIGKLCKHAVGLLVAWQRQPDSFVVSEGPPEGGGEKKKATTKKGKVDEKAVMGQGISEVATLLKELAVSGTTIVGEERVAGIRSMGETLKQNKLRRLSPRTIELAEILAQNGVGKGLDPSEYADLFCDMLLTTRKLEKHLAGEPLEDRHVEELIGKVWQSKSLPEVGDLHLLEYAYAIRETADGFRIFESRFIDLTSGKHYSEKLIQPLQFAKEAKRSFRNQVLLAAKGHVYPGYSPFRLKFTDTGTAAPLSQEALAQMVAVAANGASAAIASYQEQRKDVFSPDRMPVAVRADVLYASGDHLRAIDEQGQALSLPFRPGQDMAMQALELRFASLLRGVRLRVLLGDIEIDEAQPTLHPMALICEGPLGLELHQLTSAPESDQKQKKRRLRRPQPGAIPAGSAQAGWADLARAAGASEAAVSLAEVREDLAALLTQGLAALTTRQVEPLCQRLTDLGLAKQAALLAGIPARPDPEERLDDFIKLYQVLEIALTRLCSAVRVDRGTLTPVPTYESVQVRSFDQVYPAREILAKRQRGEIGRYEAAAHLARYYAGLSAEQMEAAIYPTWADGSATPYVVRALGTRGAAAVRAASKALKSKGLMSKTTALQVLGEVARAELQKGDKGDRTVVEEATALLKQAEAGGFHQSRSFAQHAYWYFEQAGTHMPLTVLARRMLDTIVLLRPKVALSEVQAIDSRRRKHQQALGQHLQRATSAPTFPDRQEGVRWLAKMGDVLVAPELRRIAAEDPSSEVRNEALLALGLLGDSEMVDLLVGMLSQRQIDADRAKVAAYALGYLGDARGIDELLRAFADTWNPAVIGEALRSVGWVVLAPMLSVLEGRPDLLSRKVVAEVLRKLPPEELAPAIIERLELAQDEAALLDRGKLYFKLTEPVPALFVLVAKKMVQLGKQWQETHGQEPTKELVSLVAKFEKAGAADKPKKAARGTPAI